MNLKEFANVDSFWRDLDTGETIEWRDYMARIINKIGINSIKPYIPYDMETLMERYRKGDIHFNDGNMSIKVWDRAAGFDSNINPQTKKMDYNHSRRGLGPLLIHNGINLYSCSEAVCILKETARILCEKEIKKYED